MPKPSAPLFNLRELFDELIELAPPLRNARLDSLALPEEGRVQLQAMVMFEELSALAPELRSAHMAGLDLPAAVQRRLHSMFMANARMPVLMRASAIDAIDALADDEGQLAATMIGSTVGSFRLVDVLGFGGSSIVFRAERDAGDGRQVVALKLLRTGLYTNDAQRRFRREQAFLAQLTHPNIARLVEGGVSAHGAPYIAMELVEGEPITRAANMRGLNIQGRLAWFEQLCRTIDAAHGALIVHRDLKPSNLFVTAAGVLKVLDFGIAKLVDTDDDGTRTLSIALTPEYAAPEQFVAGALTTAVDVYALGVVLGEMLTGLRLGHGAAASKAVAAARTTLEVPAGLPPPGALVRLLRGDLDAIIATALDEDPRRRYRSAGALGDDVGRYLAGKPVRAHAPSRWYRARKFITRHRVGLGLAALLLAGIIGSLGIAVWKGLEAQRAAALALHQAARADSMRDFMFDAFAQAEPAKPRDGAVTIVEVVNRAVEKARNDHSIEPRARTELLARLAQVVGAQGDLERSGTLLAGIRQDAAALPADDPLLLEVERLVENNTFLRGNYPQARQQVDALLAKTPPTLPALRSRLLRDSAQIALMVRQNDRALADSNLALEIAQHTDDANLARGALDDLGTTLLGISRLPEAIHIYEQILAQDRARFGANSVEVSLVLSDLARAYRRSGDLARAEAYAREAVQIDRLVYTGDHWIISKHLNALGQALVARRDLDGARQAYEESARISAATLGPEHSETEVTHQALAYVETQLEDYAAAEPNVSSALRANERQFGEHHWQTAFVRADYGYLIALRGRLREGIGELERAIADLQALQEPDPHLLGRTLERRIRVALLGGDVAAASQRIERLRDLAAGAGNTREHAVYWTGRTDCLRGEIELAAQRPAAAVTVLKRCGDTLDGAETPDAVLRVEQRLLLARAQVAAGDAAAKTTATEGRERLKALAYAPSRLVKLAAELPQ